MALPIGPYQGQDLINYEAGNKFLPRQFYSLNSPIPTNTMGNNGGITSTQAAGSYMGYPSYEAWLLAQGGGGGNGGGRDDNITNTYNVNQNLGSTNITDYEAEASDVGPTWAGSWAKAKDLYSKLPTPGNLIMKGIRHWKQRREDKIAKDAAIEQARIDQISQQSQANAAAAGQVQRGGGAGDSSRSHMGGISQSQADAVGAANAAAGMSGWGLAQGGRAGYKWGELVDENIEGPGFDENIEMASAVDPMDALNDMSMEIFNGRQLHELTPEEYQILIDMANDQAMGEQDQGIASLV